MAETPAETNTSPSDPKAIVKEGYDRLSSRYLEWKLSNDNNGDLNIPSSHQSTFLQKMFSHLLDSTLRSGQSQGGAKVLDLGCGPGIPYTKTLLQHPIIAEVVANDISVSQIALAKTNLGDQARCRFQLIHGDMTGLEFPAETFDAIVAFYSMIHLPRVAQAPFLKQQVTYWLRPGGLLLLNLGVHDDPGSIEKKWLGREGATMFWSSWDEHRNLEMIRQAGFKVLEAEVLEDDEDGRAVPFLWVLAEKEEMMEYENEA